MSCVVTEGQEGWQTFTTLISRPDRRIVNPEFLAAFINSSVGCRQIQSLQAGGAQQNLNSRVLETLLVPVPRLEEQGRIVHVLGDLEAAAGQIRFQFQKLIHIKNGLMQELLRGRVSVSALITDSSGLSLIGEATSAP